MAAIGAADASTATDLFYSELIESYLAAHDWVRRDWLEQEIVEQLEDPGCRYVLVAAEPGAGKTGVMAALAASHPDWLRYFIRRDSTTPLSGGDAASMLLRIGHQLANIRPQLFEPDRLEIVVRQRVGQAGAGAEVVGVRIEDLAVSPFHRTAIKVEQDVGTLEADLIALDVAHATVEPRLLEPSVLQYLALLDPAAVLAQEEPDALIVVVVDALDEVFRFRAGESALDWLERSPELPSNVRFVLSARPHKRLAVLRGARESSVRAVDIVPDSDKVLADVRSFAVRLFDDLASWLPDVGGRHTSADGLTRVADGNFAYLNAYARGLRGAAAEGNVATLRGLLEFDALPRGLAPLYAYFLRRLQQDIAALGDLEVKDPPARGPAFVPAWEGVGQRFVGVFAVARAPLALDQLVSFGSVRVWPREAGNVLERFVPFLDSIDGRYRLFHASLAEFLTAKAEPGVEDVAVDESEWHLRIVRHYLGAATTWAAVDWRQADDYAFLHLAEHLVELGDDGVGRVRDLVNPALREAALDRFLTDLPFRRIVDTALADARDASDLAEALSSTVFLALVRKGLLAGGSRLAPSLLGLMARLGRTREALARCELMPPSQYRFRCLEAVTACLAEQDRDLLGPHDGADRLVAAALEIPETASPMPGVLGMERKRCLEAASVALAPFDAERAVGLAAMAELDDSSKHQDETLLAAIRVARAADLPALVDRMAGAKALGAAVAADRVPPGTTRDGLIELAYAHLDSAPAEHRIRALAHLAISTGGATTADGRRALSALRAVAVSQDGKEASWERGRACLEAAKHIRSTDPAAAEGLLDAVTPERKKGEGHIDTWVYLEAAGLFAEWGEQHRACELVNRVLAYERSLGWYGPASDIMSAAGVVHAFDPSWARELSEEAVALIEPALESTDEYERSRLEGTLSGMVRALLPWDLPRAQEIARQTSGSWISGGDWDSISGRSSALGMIGLKLADGDPGQASELLEECLASERARVVIGRADPIVVRGGPFAPAGEGPPGDPRLFRAGNFMVYVQNSINYWLGGREWRFFRSPIDVLRSMAPFPGSRGSPASWAGVVAAAATIVAEEHPELALDLVGRIVEPSERLLACAGIAGALSAAGDGRTQAVLAAVDRAAANLPVYENEIDLDKLPQGPVLRYLNPSARAQLEAAILLPPDAAGKAAALAQATGSWYLDTTFRSEKQWRQLFASIAAEVPDAEVASAVMAVVHGLEKHPDDIQADLIRIAASFSLASRGLSQAREIIDAIKRPSARALAEIYALAAAPPPGQSLGTACMMSLRTLPDTMGPLDRACLAAQTMVVLPPDDQESRTKVREWGTRSVSDTNPLFELIGLAMLAAAAPGAEKATLISAALARGDQIANFYLRADALADALGPALETRDVALIGRAAQQLLDADWQVLVEGLRRGAGELIDAIGPDVVDTLDAALRRAQDVLNRGLIGTEHLDGVLPPGSPDVQPIPLEYRPPADPVQFYPLYLEQKDLPASLAHVQDSRDQGADPDDFAFTVHNGMHSGFAVWMGNMEDPVWRVVDIRYVFPTSNDAAEYLADRAPALGENNPVVADATSVGDSCTVFGATTTTRFGATNVEMTMFFYVFRVGTVVVKLFAAQGPNSSENLAPDMLVPVAEKIVDRIRKHGL